MEERLSDISKRLGLHLNTLERWIRQGRIPIIKHGSFGNYKEAELNRWAENQRNKVLIKKDEKQDEPGSPDVLLLAAMEAGGVFHGISGSLKEDVLGAVVKKVPDFPGKNTEALFQQLMEREKLMSTGIGHGIAIPHPRNPLRENLKTPMVTTCFLEKTVDFNAIDNMPVSVIFLLLSPSVECHLNLLSRLSFCLRDKEFIAFVQGAPDADELLTRVETMVSLT